jgi:hypothetical protein
MSPIPMRNANSLTIEVPAGVRLLSNELDGRNAPMTLADVDGDFPAKVQVGLVACNMSKQPLSAQFEEFVLVTEKKDLTDPMKP